jgi:predicted HTH transcriptional regulator
MKENQNIEWKESWHNDHFKWICGFANAQGGVLFIGKDDDGSVKHLANGSVSNSEVQTICNVSKATATRYLGELEADWVDKIGSTGVGTVYVFKGLSKGSKKE